MRKCHAIVALLALSLVSADTKQPGPRAIEIYPDQIGTHVSIIGSLGRPVGEMLTITGKKVRAGKGDEIYFVVEAVNGQPLVRPEGLQIRGIIDWPLGTKAEIRGQEEGTVTFLDEAKHSYGRQYTGKPFPVRQTIDLSFVAKKVVSPTNLTLKAGR